MSEKILFNPFIGVLAGLPFTGKSTLGEEISRRSNITFIDVDVIRQEIEDSDKPKKRGTEEQEKLAMFAAYTKTHEKAQQLVEGQPVLLAATYSRSTYHKQIKELAKKANKELIVFLLTVSDEILRERIETRKPSNPSYLRTFKDYVTVRDRYEEIEDVSLNRIKTDIALEENIEKIFTVLEKFRQH